MSKITVLGAGGFGTALAIMCAKMGHEVRLWSLFQHEVDQLKADREHKKLLPGVKLPENISITTELSCASGADLIIMAVPSFAVRETAARFRDVLADGTVVVNVGKGLESGTFKRLSVVIAEELPQAKAAVLSGPSHAEEVCLGVPTTVVASSLHRDAASQVQDLLMNQVFRVYLNADVTGVELGGALKNIIALAAGVCDGLRLGDNTKAALMTRGLTEIARLGVALGAHTETFAGLTGIGDLVVTCTSMHSRNRRAGILIGGGMDARKAVEQVGMVEGYHATRTAFRLAQQCGVEMPITEQCYHVLYEGKAAREAITALMGRPKKSEGEHIWLDC